MTILPKKKQTKEKSEADGADHSQLPAAQENRVARRTSSPPRGWIASTSKDRLSSHDPGGLYDASYESSSNHNVNKRRHRSSPHRSARKHRHDRPSCSSPNPHPSHDTSTSQMEMEDDLQSGYNSEDEYVPPPHPDNIEEVFCVHFSWVNPHKSDLKWHQH